MIRVWIKSFVEARVFIDWRVSQHRPRARLDHADCGLRRQPRNIFGAYQRDGFGLHRTALAGFTGDPHFLIAESLGEMFRRSRVEPAGLEGCGRARTGKEASDFALVG